MRVFSEDYQRMYRKVGKDYELYELQDGHYAYIGVSVTRGDEASKYLKDGKLPKKSKGDDGS